MLDVGDPVRNTMLNVCFFSIALLTVASIIPWRIFGATRLSGLARWVVVPVVTLAVVYEMVMPSSYDIRIDLFLLLPMYGVVVMSSLIRWLSSRKI